MKNHTKVDLHLSPIPLQINFQMQYLQEHYYSYQIFNLLLYTFGLVYICSTQCIFRNLK